MIPMRLELVRRCDSEDIFCSRLFTYLLSALRYIIPIVAISPETIPSSELNLEYVFNKGQVETGEFRVSSSSVPIIPLRVFSMQLGASAVVYSVNPPSALMRADLIIS